MLNKVTNTTIFIEVTLYSTPNHKLQTTLFLNVTQTKRERRLFFVAFQIVP